MQDSKRLNKARKFSNESRRIALLFLSFILFVTPISSTVYATQLNAYSTITNSWEDDNSWWEDDSLWWEDESPWWEDESPWWEDESPWWDVDDSWWEVDEPWWESSYENNPIIGESTTTSEVGVDTTLRVLDQSDEYFFNEVTQLVTDAWDDSYIGEVLLTIGNPYMFVDEEQQRVDFQGQASPVIVEDELLIPVTALIEETGGYISIDDGGQNLTIVYDYVIEMEIDETVMSVDGQQQYVDTAPMLIDDSVMLSTETIADELGFEVDWDPTMQQITLTRNFQTNRLILRLASDLDLTNFGATTAIKGPDNIAVLQFETISQTQEAYEQLSELSAVVWVEPDLYIPMSGLESVEFNTQNANLSTTRPSVWNVDRVRTNRYAEFLRSTGVDRRVTVAVVDSGVDLNHPFLRDRIDFSWCVVTNSRNPADRSGHGTHVTGIIIANTPEVDNIRIMSINAFHNQGSTDMIMSRALRFAVENGADVINASFGGIRSNLHREALDFVVSNNISVVTSAGNDGEDAGNIYPAAHPNVITVTAVDSNDRPASFSNFGTVVDLAAPGANIVSSSPGGRFNSDSGTSMATPHVTAGVAMYIARNPGLTPAAVQAAMRRYVDVPANWQSRFGTGIFNMQRAITTEAPATTAPPTTQAPTAVPPPAAPPPNPAPTAPQQPGPTAPQQPPGGTAPQQPPGGTAPQQPPGGTAPQQPPGGTAPQQPPGGTAPQQPPGGTAPQQPPGGTAPQQPPGGTAPQQPPGGTAPQQPPGGGTPPQQPPAPEQPGPTPPGSGAEGNLVLSRGRWFPGPNAISITVGVTTDRTWTVSSNVDWLTVSDINPVNQTGDGSFTLNATTNTRMMFRTAIVTVTAPGAPERRVLVAQTPAIPCITRNNGGKFRRFRNRRWNPNSRPTQHRARQNQRPPMQQQHMQDQ